MLQYEPTREGWVYLERLGHVVLQVSLEVFGAVEPQSLGQFLFLWGFGLLDERATLYQELSQRCCLCRAILEKPHGLVLAMRLWISLGIHSGQFRF